MAARPPVPSTAAGQADLVLADRISTLSPHRVLWDAGQEGIRFITPGDPEWPDQLAELRHAGNGGVPLVLWVRGEANLREATTQALTVTGAKRPSEYGRSSRPPTRTRQSKTVVCEVDVPDALERLVLPTGVDERLTWLLDRQDERGKLTPAERREAEGLVDMAELLALLRARAQRLGLAAGS